MKKFILSLITLVTFFLSVTQVNAFKKESFVTATVLVRGQENWSLVDQKPLDLPLFYYEQASQSGIPTSYMLRYDAIEDKEISSRLADLVATDSAQILGGLLEITPKLAQKANVNYQNNGGFTTANRIFLSGYDRKDRLKIIDTYMDTFFNRFGNYPSVVGVDSLDSFSFNYLVSHYSVIAAFTEDETYQGGNLRHWGGILAEPYLPSKTNILLPAQDTKNKINGVIFKWSPSDPLNFYSKNSTPRSILSQIPDILEIYTLKSLNESTNFNVRLDNNYQLIFHTEDKLQKSNAAKNAITNLITQLKSSQDKHTLVFKSTAEMGETIEKINYIIKISQDTVSLETSVGDDEEDSTLLDFIEDVRTVAPDRSAAQQLLREYVGDAIKDLNAREQKILQMRFGLLEQTEINLIWKSAIQPSLKKI